MKNEVENESEVENEQGRGKTMSQIEAAMLLQHMMNKKQKQILDAAIKQASKHLADQISGIEQIPGIDQIPGVNELMEAVNSQESAQTQDSDRDQQEPAQDENIRMSDTKIYIGLNDAETKEQKFETKRYLEVLKNVCRSYHMAFSVDIEQGGYFHDDGEYTEENSLVLTLIDADKAVVEEIAKDLCVFFHQESVLITEGYVSGRYVSLSAVAAQEHPEEQPAP